jgi:hypothetical protein
VERVVVDLGFTAFEPNGCERAERLAGDVLNPVKLGHEKQQAELAF